MCIRDRFIPGFEEQLIGLGVGDKHVVKVTFPQAYPAENLAGKAAEFDVVVKSVDVPKEVAGALRLRLVLPRDSRNVEVPCELVWRSDRYDAATGRPSGMAVRFLSTDPDMHRRIDEFATEGFRPSAAPTPIDHYEYRIIERATVDVADLNRFGKDGWRLVSIIPSAHGFKLILTRRL